MSNSPNMANKAKVVAQFAEPRCVNRGGIHIVYIPKGLDMLLTPFSMEKPVTLEKKNTKKKESHPVGKIQVISLHNTR